MSLGGFMSKQIKKSSNNDNIIIAWIKELNYYFRVKLRFNAIQSIGFILIIFIFPISLLFGFTGEKYLSFKLIFGFNLLMIVILIIYTIKNYEKIQKSQNNVLNLEHITTIEEVDSLSSNDFERFVGLLFKEWGFFVEHTQSTHDQGADLLVEKGNTDYVVDAKKRTKTRINDSILNNLVTKAKKDYRTNKTWLVTNSFLNTGARHYYEQNKDTIKVTDRQDIKKYLRRKRNKGNN
jgi:restriction system protein